MQKQSFTIGNVHCSSCEGKVIKLLSALEGVEEVIVNVLRKKMYVTLDTKLTTVADIEKTMQGAGYTASPLWVTDTADTVAVATMAEGQTTQITQITQTAQPLEQTIPTFTTPFTMAPPMAPTMPAQSASENTAQESGLKEQAFLLHKTHCSSCQGKIHAALMAIDGIVSAEVNTLRRSVVVRYAPEKILPAGIIQAFQDSKYKLQEVNKNALPPLIPSIQDVKQKKLPALEKNPPAPTSVEKEKTLHDLPQSAESKKMHEQNFKIGNVHCSSCEDRVQKLLMALGGIEKVQVNLLRKTMHVRFDSTCIDAKGIAAAMAGAGYSAAPIQSTLNALQDVAPKVGTKLSPMLTSTLENKSAESQNTNKARSYAEAEVQEQQNIPYELLTSLFFAAVLMYVAMAPMFSLPLPQIFSAEKQPLSWAALQALLCLPIIFCHRRIFTSGFRALIQASPNMDSLVGLGSTAATLFGCYAVWKIHQALGVQDVATLKHFVNNLYFDSAGMILALIGLGKHFESKARAQAGSAIDALIRLAPATAICLRDGEEISIATADVRIGDILVVHAGQSLAADGVIVHGHAFIDTSIITGESLPQEKHVGDTVIGATVSQSGYFHMRVTKAGHESTLARIIDLVESATASKAPIARLADRISAIFVPCIISIALLTFGTWLYLDASLEFAVSAAISVLVISCPCALGLATPTAIMVGMGMGAKKGILFKDAAALEHLQGVDTVILDKTGTLTHGKPVVTDILPAQDYNEEELLLFAASLEKLSEHPLGQTIVQEAEAKKMTLLTAETFTSFQQLPGLGLSAIKKELPATQLHVLAGNARFLAKENIDNPLQEKEKELARQGKTVLYFAENKKLLGLIAVADTIKKSSKGAVQCLKALGLNVIMLTGDNAQTAKAVQHQVDIETIVAEVLPQEKEEQVQKLEASGHKVAMVGDGINDAPALARAHVGIAIGAGTDIAINSADVVLMQSDVAHVVQAVHLSKAVMRTIRQNLFWAFAYNVVLIPVAAGLFVSFGMLLSPMLAAASMSLSSLTVVGNALRLRWQNKAIFENFSR